MKIRHHLYTFVPEKRNQRGGAQTIYASPSLSAEARARLERHSIYERPDWLGPDDPIEKYPISYGYFLLDEGHGVLARVVYRGRHGIRAGNFLAHHIIFPLYAFEEGDPLLHLEDPVLFRGDYREDEAPPVDIDLPVLPERDPTPEAFPDVSLVNLLACAITSVTQSKGPRVVAILPQEFFDTKMGLRLALSLSTLLPPSLRLAFTFRTYQLDPIEFKARLLLSPMTTSNLKTLKGDAQFLLFDPQGNMPALPQSSLDYAEMAVSLWVEQDAERLALLQEGFSALFQSSLDKVESVRNTLTLYLQAVEASAEGELMRLMSSLSGLDEASGRLVGDALFARFGAAYLKALTAGKLSSVGLRVLQLAKSLDSEEVKRALLGFVDAARQAPDRAPWAEFFSLFGALPSETQKGLLALISENAREICEKLSSEQLLFLLDVGGESSGILFGAMEQLKTRGELTSHWTRLEKRLKDSVVQGDAQKLFLVLSTSGLYSAASDLFLKKILPTEKDVTPLLPAVIEAMQRTRIEDGEIGRRLLAQAPEETKREILLFAAKNNLMATWRVSISEQPLALLSSVQKAADETIKPGLFAEELARVGLWRQVLRLRLTSSQEPFSEAIEPALLAARTPTAIESIIDIALEKPTEVVARKLLLFLASRANEAQMTAKVEALAERVYAKMPEARRYAILPAVLLEKRSTRFWGAKVLHNDMNRTISQRKEILSACLERVTLLDGSESELGLALRSAFHDATDERLRWLHEEAKRVGLPVVAQIAAQGLTR
jgi:hypothetical protein